MIFKSFDTVSENVRRQIGEVVGAWRACLGDSLEGAYLQGSMVLGRFVEGISDIDLLFVVSKRITRDERLALAKDMIKLDYKPSTIEMSALYTGDIFPWKHPTPCQFHYSNSWTERYRDMISGEMPECFIIDTDFEDRDIACHVRLTRESGICLYGKPASETLPAVPEEDFVDSLMYDIEDDAFSDEDEDSAVSAVLSLARVYSYVAERRIISKYDAALWASERIPDVFTDILNDAVLARYDGKPWHPHEREKLEKYREYFLNQIRVN